MPLKSILNHVESLKSFVSTRESVVITAGRSTEIKVAAATRIKNPAPTTRHGLPGRSCWRGWGRSFPSSAPTAAATSASTPSSRR